MAAAAQEVAAARFLLTSGHLVATCLAVSQHDRGDASAAGAGAVAFASFALALSAFALGLDVFSPPKNAVHVCCHFLGGVMVCRQLLYALPAPYLWNVVVVAHVPPALCSLSTLVDLFMLRTGRHAY